MCTQLKDISVVRWTIKTKKRVVIHELVEMFLLIKLIF